MLCEIETVSHPEVYILWLAPIAWLVIWAWAISTFFRSEKRTNGKNLRK